VSGQLHAPAASPPGKSPRYPFYRRLGGKNQTKYKNKAIIIIIIIPLTQIKVKSRYIQ
jgi:hypothetical protein